MRILFLHPDHPDSGLSFQAVSSSLPPLSDWRSELLNSRLFDTFENEKISLDLGPWIKQMSADARRASNFQVRIRTTKHRQSTYPLGQVVIAIVRLITRILKCSRGNDFPDLSLWHLSELQQKADRLASFNCHFTVQGATRLIHSHEPDVEAALHELSRRATPPTLVPPASQLQGESYGEHLEDGVIAGGSGNQVWHEMVWPDSLSFVLHGPLSPHILPLQHTSRVPQQQCPLRGYLMQMAMACPFMASIRAMQFPAEASFIDQQASSSQPSVTVVDEHVRPREEPPYDAW